MTSGKNDLEIWRSTVAGVEPFEHMNPAETYINMILQSSQSRETARSVLRTVALLAGYRNVEETRGGKTKIVGDPDRVPWHALTDIAINHILETLKAEGRSSNTRNLYLSVLKGVATQAVTLGQMDEAIYARIQRLRGNKAIRELAGRAPYVQEVTKLVDHCLRDEGLAGIRDAAILGLLFGAGPRRAELVSINVEKLNLKDSEVRVIGKGDKERTLELPPRALDLVKTWIAEARLSSGALFRPMSKHGMLLNKRLTGKGVSYIIKSRQEQAGLEKLTPHDFRRAFITYLLETENLATVAHLAGHANTATTQRYDRGAAKRGKAAVSKIEF